LHSLQYLAMRVAIEKWDAKICFKIINHELPPGCCKYHQIYEIKLAIRWVTISWESVPAHLSLNFKWQIKKKSFSIKGNSVSIHERCFCYDSYFKAMLFKYAEQTNNCVAARKCSVYWGKHPKVETIKTRTLPILHENICLYGLACTNHEEKEVCFTEKFFTLERS
jgi:hypothetical protein